MGNNLILQKFEVQVKETYEMTEKAISLTERLDKLKNLLKAQGILSNDAERFFLYLDKQIRVHRDSFKLWIHLPTKTTVSILNKLDKTTTMEEVDSILSQTTFGK
jgi:hypothetical protein